MEVTMKRGLSFLVSLAFLMFFSACPDDSGNGGNNVIPVEPPSTIKLNVKGR
jgi:hypothetical protein